jgi:large subunit ribosomal protein L15
MIGLHTLKPHPRSRHRKKRVGRGPGSGTGKTSGRGHKGQLARGPGPRPGFEGGQMPLIRVIPKRGFSARSKRRFQIINLKDLAKYKQNDTIDIEILVKENKVRSNRPVKILAKGELKERLKVRAHAFSKSAMQKIQKAGGECEVVPSKC